MNQFFSTRRLAVLKWPAAMIILLLCATDASASPFFNDADTVKCVNMKPAPTSYSTNLNNMDHAIPLDQAVNMVNNFGVVREAMLGNDFTGRDMLPISETFNLQAIDQLICQPSAIGFRVYLALDDNQKVRLVLVGVDGDGKDIIQRKNENPGLSSEAAANSGVSSEVYETGQRWP